MIDILNLVGLLSANLFDVVIQAQLHQVQLYLNWLIFWIISIVFSLGLCAFSYFQAKRVAKQEKSYYKEKSYYSSAADGWFAVSVVSGVCGLSFAPGIVYCLNAIYMHTNAPQYEALKEIVNTFAN